MINVTAEYKITHIYIVLLDGKERRLGRRFSLFRVVEKVFSLVKAFREKFRSLVKAGFLRMIEDEKFSQKAQPTFS